MVIKEFSVGNKTICLSLHNDQPIAQHDTQYFPQLWLLVDYLKELSDPANIELFAQISNFMWKGPTFAYIPSIREFQKSYHERIRFEQQNPADLLPYRVTDSPIFDVSIMHPPKLEGSQLSYFVYNVSNGLPYRVVCPFPYHATSTVVHYQILPY